MRFGDRVKAYPPKGVGVTARDLRDRLEEACAACGEHDQVVFVFSGRGFQTAADRYLVTEDARPFRRAGEGFSTGPAPAEFDSGLTVEPGSVVRLTDVSTSFARAKGNCLAVLDCQFTQPTSTRNVLDKHLDSVKHGDPTPLWGPARAPRPGRSSRWPRSSSRTRRATLTSGGSEG